MQKKKILIIDDDYRNIFALKATLVSKGFDCISCTSATEALVLLNDNKTIDTILIDMMMPELDGYEAIPKIKKIVSYTNIPIISVTAQAMQGDKERCLAAGADGYVSKPINVDTLLTLLAKHNIKND